LGGWEGVSKYSVMNRKDTLPSLYSMNNNEIEQTADINDRSGHSACSEIQLQWGRLRLMKVKCRSPNLNAMDQEDNIIISQNGRKQSCRS
jgi:hypothetical protein